MSNVKTFRENTLKQLGYKPKNENNQQYKKHFQSSLLINVLPKEILLHIFSFLDPASVLSCIQVSNYWKNLANSNEVWRVVYKQHILYHTTTKKQKLGSLQTIDGSKPLASGHWKNLFFQRCKNMRNKRFNALNTKNAYTGVTNHMDEILWKLGCKFMLSICNKKGTEETFIETKHKTFDCVTTVQWDSLTEWPRFTNISKISIHSLTPLMYGKDKKPLYNSPTQKCLLLEENIANLGIPLTECDQLIVYRTHQNLFVALWKNSKDIAFVSVGLHHHKLLSKCLKSLSDKIYSIPHEVYPDDVDLLYGLHGYKCHMHLHTFDVSLWNEKFNCLYSRQSQAFTETPMEDYINFEPHGYEMHGRISSNIFIKWTTELFNGKIPNAVMISLTMCDINEEVIWYVSVPLVIQTSQSKNGDFSCSGDAKIMEFGDNIGQFKIFLNEDGKKLIYIKRILLRLKLDFINKWFGTDYKA